MMMIMMMMRVYLHPVESVTVFIVDNCWQRVSTCSQDTEILRLSLT